MAKMIRAKCDSIIKPEHYNNDPNATQKGAVSCITTGKIKTLKNETGD